MRNKRRAEEIKGQIMDGVTVLNEVFIEEGEDYQRQWPFLCRCSCGKLFLAGRSGVFSKFKLKDRFSIECDFSCGCKRGTKMTKIGKMVNEKYLSRFTDDGKTLKSEKKAGPIAHHHHYYVYIENSDFLSHQDRVREVENFILRGAQRRGFKPKEKFSMLGAEGNRVLYGVTVE